MGEAQEASTLCKTQATMECWEGENKPPKWKSHPIANNQSCKHKTTNITQTEQATFVYLDIYMYILI